MPSTWSGAWHPRTRACCLRLGAYNSRTVACNSTCHACTVRTQPATQPAQDWSWFFRQRNGVPYWLVRNSYVSYSTSTWQASGRRCVYTAMQHACTHQLHHTLTPAGNEFWRQRLLPHSAGHRRVWHWENSRVLQHDCRYSDGHLYVTFTCNLPCQIIGGEVRTGSGSGSSNARLQQSKTLLPLLNDSEDSDFDDSGTDMNLAQDDNAAQKLRVKLYKPATVRIGMCVCFGVCVCVCRCLLPNCRLYPSSTNHRNPQFRVCVSVRVCVCVCNSVFFCLGSVGWCAFPATPLFHTGCVYELARAKYTWDVWNATKSSAKDVSLPIFEITIEAQAVEARVLSYEVGPKPISFHVTLEAVDSVPVQHGFWLRGVQSLSSAW